VNEIFATPLSRRVNLKLPEPLNTTLAFLMLTTSIPLLPFHFHHQMLYRSLSPNAEEYGVFSCLNAETYNWQAGLN
jgi:hypothetical protein